MKTEELLALGMFGGESRLGDRIEILLERGRLFSPRASRSRVAVSAVAMLGCVIAAPFTPRLIAFAEEPVRFEVASVKPMSPEQRQRGRQLTCEAGRRFLAKQTLWGLIRFGYQVSDFQISGGPTWMNSPDSVFDIEAKPAVPVSSDDCRRMVQTLLTDRFKLALHRETKDMPVYALIVGSKGPKVHEAEGDEPSGMRSNIMINGAPIQVNDNYQHGTARGMTMQQLAAFLQLLTMIGRPVLDETSLKGIYALTLEYAEMPGADDRPDIFTAVQEQLGLKLEPRREPVEVLVIDHVEKPDAN